MIILSNYFDRFKIFDSICKIFGIFSKVKKSIVLNSLLFDYLREYRYLRDNWGVWEFWALKTRWFSYNIYKNNIEHDRKSQSFTYSFTHSWCSSWRERPQLHLRRLHATIQQNLHRRGKGNPQKNFRLKLRWSFGPSGQRGDLRR